MTNRIDLVFCAAALLSACAPLQSAREASNTQIVRDEAAKFAELAPAEGHFQGIAHFTREDLDLEFELDLQRVSQNVSAPGPTPVDVAHLPRLKGHIALPGLREGYPLNWRAESIATETMAGHAMAWIDAGDYSASLEKLVLPYSLPEVGGGDFGEIIAQLSGDEIRGKWFTKAGAQVAEISLKRSSP